jgi:hypothetical protein
MSRLNFSIAGGFMFSMLLSSVTENEVEYWTKEIGRYRRLLEMQSLSFDTTKLAVSRMNLLAAVGYGGGPGEERRGSRPGSEGSGGICDPKQAFCRDFGVELNTL